VGIGKIYISKKLVDTSQVFLAQKHPRLAVGVLVGSEKVVGLCHGVFDNHRFHLFRSRVLSEEVTMLRILIADDHELARNGIRALLESHPGWEVCGEAKDGRETVELATSLRPDIVLLDIGMPNLNGLEAARQILTISPEVAILILTMHDSDNVVREVLRAGARGYLLKSDAGRDLVAAVEALQLQRTFFTTRVSQMVLDGYLDRQTRNVGTIGKDKDDERTENSLTSREREVIQLLAEGKTSKEVAVTLNLSVKTAETHRTNLMRKLGLHSVADLTRYAVRNGIVQVF
jgi:DNA-binding NarL/FixJ family response regulator